jgi:Ca2+/Na+ antiporter
MNNTNEPTWIDDLIKWIKIFTVVILFLAVVIFQPLVLLLIILILMVLIRPSTVIMRKIFTYFIRTDEEYNKEDGTGLNNKYQLSSFENIAFLLILIFLTIITVTNIFDILQLQIDNFQNITGVTIVVCIFLLWMYFNIYEKFFYYDENSKLDEYLNSEYLGGRYDKDEDEDENEEDKKTKPKAKKDTTSKTWVDRVLVYTIMFLFVVIIIIIFTKAKDNVKNTTGIITMKEIHKILKHAYKSVVQILYHYVMTGIITFIVALDIILLWLKTIGLGSYEFIHRFLNIGVENPSLPPLAGKDLFQYTLHSFGIFLYEIGFVFLKTLLKLFILNGLSVIRFTFKPDNISFAPFVELLDEYFKFEKKLKKFYIDHKQTSLGYELSVFDIDNLLTRTNKINHKKLDEEEQNRFETKKKDLQQIAKDHLDESNKLATIADEDGRNKAHNEYKKAHDNIYNWTSNNQPPIRYISCTKNKNIDKESLRLPCPLEDRIYPDDELPLLKNFYLNKIYKKLFWANPLKNIDDNPSDLLDYPQYLISSGVDAKKITLIMTLLMILIIAFYWWFIQARRNKHNKDGTPGNNNHYDEQSADFINKSIMFSIVLLIINFLIISMAIDL